MSRDSSTPFEVKSLHIPDLKAYLDKMNMQGFEVVTITVDLNLELAMVIHKHIHKYEVV